jgi:hypothetical protein
MRAPAVPLLPVVVVALLSSTAPLAAQVTASQAPTPSPSVDQEICPLQLDFDLSPHLAKLHEAARRRDGERLDFPVCLRPGACRAHYGP